MAYSEKVLDHYENPRNVGKMDTGDINVGTGMVGAPACGDVMKLQIKVEKGIITDALTQKPLEATIEIIDNKTNELVATFLSNSSSSLLSKNLLSESHNE